MLQKQVHYGCGCSSLGYTVPLQHRDLVATPAEGADRMLRSCCPGVSMRVVRIPKLTSGRGKTSSNPLPSIRYHTFDEAATCCCRSAPRAKSYGSRTCTPSTTRGHDKTLHQPHKPERTDLVMRSLRRRSNQIARSARRSRRPSAEQDQRGAI